MVRVFNPFRKKSLDCAEVRKLSSAYLEEELPTSKLNQFRSHIARCGPCMSFVNGLASVMGMLAKLPKMEVPPGLKESILDNTTRKNQPGNQPNQGQTG